MGPWGPNDLTLDNMLELDTLHGAFVIEYATHFERIINPSRQVPTNLQEAHEQIVDLRNRRFAHSDQHPSIDGKLSAEIENQNIKIKHSLRWVTTLGMPTGWEDLLEWLDGYYSNQIQKITNHLNSNTDYIWGLASPADWSNSSDNDLF